MLKREKFHVTMPDGKVRHMREKGMEELKEEMLISKVRDRMTEFGFTQEVVAKRIGVKQGTISAFLLGRMGLSLSTLCLLMTTLDLEVRPTN